MKKHILALALLSAIGTAACTGPQHKVPEQTTTIDTTLSGPDRQQDSIALLQLTQRLYRWHETANETGDFDPELTKPTDTVYAGLDQKAHQQRLKDMAETGLFARLFLDRYDQLAAILDREMRNGALVWYVGELPPFGNDADPWCNCQDTPENFLQGIRIVHVSFNKDTASWSWHSQDGTGYRIRALKEQGQWKILYLEGFDPAGFRREMQPARQD